MKGYNWRDYLSTYMYYVGFSTLLRLSSRKKSAFINKKLTLIVYDKSSILYILSSFSFPFLSSLLLSFFSLPIALFLVFLCCFAGAFPPSPILLKTYIYFVLLPKHRFPLEGTFHPKQQKHKHKGDNSTEKQLERTFQK